MVVLLRADERPFPRNLFARVKCEPLREKGYLLHRVTYPSSRKLQAFLRAQEGPVYTCLLYTSRLCYWKMRGMGWWYLPPLIALWLVLPGMLAVWYHQDPLLAATSYLRLCEQVIPLFSVWWLVMARKEELTGDGRELLYLSLIHI